MSTGNLKVKIWWDDGLSGYRMTCVWSPKTQQFLDSLKQLIPHSDRPYHAPTKVWSFPEKYGDAIEKFARAVFTGPGEVLVIKKKDAEKARTTAITANAKIDVVLAEFVKLLPFDAAQSAYRKAALTLHPDRGGDMTRMSNLNAIWDRIQKEFYKQ